MLLVRYSLPMLAPTSSRNRLEKEPSPYLRQHATNPVDWYPWGEEALEKARREDKPIVLSIGYSACHWCHVMAHESFEDEATAALMNEHFVSIKVDREERPDVDQLYQGVVQLLGRGGGWPLTVFLTPALSPFYGGTYFPSEPRHGLPSFKELLVRIAEAWTRERKALDAQGEELTQALAQVMAMGLEAVEPRPIPAQDLVEAGRLLARRTDPRFGGFGHQGPKFPNPMLLELMLRAFRRSGEAAVRDAALLTLEKMATGGIFDHLGGGFHRYSVDERWAVPHFEKMLYDSAQLLSVYAAAQEVAPRALWGQVVDQTAAWLVRELRTREGTFATAQDADTEGHEGRFFAWSRAELDEVLEDDAPLAAEHFGVTSAGNFEDGKTVLAVVKDAATLAKEHGVDLETMQTRLAQVRALLFERRQQRTAPGLDDKVLVGLNGLVLRGLCAAGRVFGRQDLVALAQVAAEQLLAGAVAPDGSVARALHQGKPRLEGTLEDAGNLALGLVALAQATLEPRYLEAAGRIADRAVARFWNEDTLAYLSADKGTKDLVVPVFALHDNAFPSGASTLTEAQAFLFALTGEGRFAEQARKYLGRLTEAITENPGAFGHLLLAADVLLDEAPKLTVFGTREQALEARRWLDRGYHPAVAFEWKEEPSGPAYVVCRGVTCSEKLPSLEAVAPLLAPRG